MVLLKRIMICVLAYLLIQYSIIFATPTSHEYEMNTFIWNLTNALETRTEQVDIPKYFWDKNDDVINALSQSFKNSPEGEIHLKSLYANNGKINFHYIDNAPIYLLQNIEDLEQVITYATTDGINDFIIAFKTPTEISSANSFIGIDPEYFYSKNIFMVQTYNKSQITTNTNAIISWNFPSVYRVSFEEIDPHMSDYTVDKFIAEKTSKINPESSVRDKVKRVNEIIVANFSYDDISSSAGKHYAKFLIETKKGVCSAYAFLAHKMLNAINVPNILITGYATNNNIDYEEHMWLMVRNERGEWLHFDPTFNDPMPDEPGKVFTKYTLISGSELSEDHSWISTDYTTNKNNLSYEKLNKLNNPIITLQINNPKMTVNNIMFNIDTNNANVTPVLINDTTFLPIRKLAEVMGASVLWDDASQTITIYYKTKTIKINIGSNIVNINGKNITILNTPIIKDGRTLLPLRNIMEILDKNVEWIQETQQIIISN